tara:strand:- start:1530 stop:1643 length:114 start_codon:yes stop_codon:yes gene_type:complete
LGELVALSDFKSSFWVKEIAFHRFVVDEITKIEFEKE